MCVCVCVCVCFLSLNLIVKLVLSLRHFVTMASMKPLFDLLSRIKLLTFKRRKSLLSRNALFISGYLGLVISVIVLLIRYLLAYGSVTFLTICLLCFAHVLFCHLVGKTFSPLQHSSVSYILLDVFSVCNILGEQINDWTQELNNMCLRKYG